MAALGEQAGAIGAASISLWRRRDARISRQAASRPSNPCVVDVLPGSSILYTSKKCSISLEQLLAAGRARSSTSFQRGSVGGTQRILASGPASSCIHITPTGRASTHTPGYVGSSSSTRASSGSPSSPSVSGMKP